MQRPAVCFNGFESDATSYTTRRIHAPWTAKYVLEQHGLARRTARCKLGQDKTRQDKTRQDKTGQDRTGQDKTGQD